MVNDSVHAVVNFYAYKSAISHYANYDLKNSHKIYPFSPECLCLFTRVEVEILLFYAESHYSLRCPRVLPDNF